MKNIYRLAWMFIVMSLVFACQNDTVPTRREIIYDENQAPVITDLYEGEHPIFEYVEGIFDWDVEIEAFNGIDSIFLNGELYRTFGDGQLRYTSAIGVEMPDADSAIVELSVMDEIGLSTTFPPFYIYAKGRIPSPYLIMDWPNAYTAVYQPTDEGYLHLPKHAGTNYANKIGWVDVPVESDMEISSKLMGAPWQGAKVGWPEIGYGFGVDAPDGTKCMRVTPTVGYMFNLIAFDTPVQEKLIADVKDRKRKFMVDVYVDDSNTTVFNLNDHGHIVLGMANVAKYHSDKPQEGQDNAMSADITKTNEWETLVFELDPNNPYARTKGDVEDNEVDMFILFVSPHFNSEGIPLTDAKYYFKNLRVEKI